VLPPPWPNCPVRPVAILPQAVTAGASPIRFWRLFLPESCWQSGGARISPFLLKG
jgi:hypothetical protein